MSVFDGHPGVPGPSADDERPRRRPRIARAQFWFALWGFLIATSIGGQLAVQLSDKIVTHEPRVQWDPSGRFGFHGTDKNGDPRYERRIDWGVAALAGLGWSFVALGLGGAVCLALRRPAFDRMGDAARFKVVMLAWGAVPAITFLGVVMNLWTAAR